MEISGDYDCVVLGDHPAGLWAALHLAGFDRRVLVVPMGSGRTSSSLPRQVALDFGWTPEDWDRAGDLLQILTPDRRFRVPENLVEFEREYRFQFGAPPERGGGVSEEIVRGLAYFARGSENGPVIPSEWKHWAQLCFHTVYFEGEADPVLPRMLRQLASQGVHLARPGSLGRIFLDRGSLVGIQLAGSSRMIATRAGLLCAPMAHLRSFLSEPMPVASEPHGWRFFMRFSCGVPCLPVGLGRRMIHVASGAPILEISQIRPGEFLLSTQLPLNEASLDRGYQRVLCERMLRVCQGIIPDLEYNLESMTPELRDPDRAEKVELPRLHPFQEVSTVPLDRLVHGASRGLGHVTPVGNLYLVNEESDPRQGLWGSFHAAVSSMEALLRSDSGMAGRSPPQLMI